MAKETTAVKKEKERYFEGIGRRKTAVARVRIAPGHGGFTVNGATLDKFFQLPRLRETAFSPVRDLKLAEKFSASVNVIGGGVSAQAEAVRHGLARALAKFDPGLIKRLRTLGYLTRDPRMVERKKYGLKKARRAPQWAKR